LFAFDLLGDIYLFGDIIR